MTINIDNPQFAKYFTPIPPNPNIGLKPHYPYKPPRPKSITLPPKTKLVNVLNFQFKNDFGFVKTANLYNLIIPRKQSIDFTNEFYYTVFNQYTNHITKLLQNLNRNRFMSHIYVKVLQFYKKVLARDIRLFNLDKNKIDWYRECYYIVQDYFRIIENLSL